MDSQELRSLQEAYLDVYNELDEGYKRFPYKKVEDKIHKKEADNPTGRGTPQSVKMGTVVRHFKGGKEVRRVEKREHSPQISKAKEEENRARGNQKEDLDLYDIILSHLLDEGYAETQEQAEVIMVNMSEEWRDGICEEYKKLPVGKMMWKVSNRATREADTRAETERQADDPYSTFTYDGARLEHEKAERNNNRNNKMIRVADAHSKKESKSKSRYKK